jgi:hypothetical protein
LLYDIDIYRPWLTRIGATTRFSDRGRLLMTIHFISAVAASVFS